MLDIHSYLSFQERVSYVILISQSEVLHPRQGLTVE